MSIEVEEETMRRHRMQIALIGLFTCLVWLGACNGNGDGEDTGTTTQDTGTVDDTGTDADATEGDTDPQDTSDEGDVRRDAAPDPADCLSRPDIAEICATGTGECAFVCDDYDAGAPDGGEPDGGTNDGGAGDAGDTGG